MRGEDTIVRLRTGISKTTQSFAPQPPSPSPTPTPGREERRRRTRLREHVLLEPPLHALEARRVDARVLLQILQGADLLAQDKGAAVDVDDGLLAHVEPEDLLF